MTTRGVALNVVEFVGQWRRAAHAAVSGAVVASAALLAVPAPAALAAPCSDVEVIFARGSGEPTGLGGTGQAFVDQLRPLVGTKTFAVYPVNYPASDDFGSPAFPATVVDGVRDAADHLQAIAANCPDTRIVLGGFSQGAAVAGFVTANAVPEGVPAAAVPQPLPPEVASHVAAVVLFGKPSDQFMQRYRAPQLTVGPLYAPNTLEICAPGDPVCGPGGNDRAHSQYAVNGQTAQGADFVAGKLA